MGYQPAHHAVSAAFDWFSLYLASAVSSLSKISAKELYEIGHQKKFQRADENNQKCLRQVSF